MNEKIQEIAYLLFKKHPEIVDPTILKDHELDDLLKELNIELNDEERVLIKIKWANLVFNLTSSFF